MSKTKAQISGQSAEHFCARVLREQGYSILEQNYFWQRRAEIDLIAVRDRKLLFIEVKARKRTNTYGGVSYAIRKDKKDKISKAALSYVQERSLNDHEVHCVAALVDLDARSIPSSCIFRHL